jgi:hypothetical protein
MYGLPAKEVQRSDQVSDVSQQAADADLQVNNLVYEQPEALSLAVSRYYMRQYFQRATYSPGETAVIDFNSGTDFVDPGNSYITFTVKTTGGTTGTASFGAGSAMNVIKQVTIRSRSGTELDRVENANLYSRVNAAYTNTNAYLYSGPGLMEGFNQSATAMAYATEYQFAIPFKRLAPFFRPLKNGQKIPPQLMSGLHMEIIWEEAKIALIQTGVGADFTGYQINDLAVMTDNVCMTDDIQKTINQQSANAGLEYAYPRVFTAQNVVPGTACNAQIRKAVSQASIAWSISLSTDNNVITADSMQGIAWDAQVWQYRLGALYFPQQQIQDNATAAVNGIESYAQAMEVFDKLKHPYCEPAVAPAQFLARISTPGVLGTNPASWGGLGIAAVSLEKDAALNMSGLPVNNSRVLELNATFANTVATRVVVTFLEYMAVARSFVDNTSVGI